MSDADAQVKTEGDEATPPPGSGSPRDVRPATAAQKLPFKKRLKIALGSLAGRGLIRLIGSTLRFELRYRDHVHPIGLAPAFLDLFRENGKPMLFALWHGECVPLLYYWRGRGMNVITSRSADGQILARVLEGLGYTTVAGSSTRGGMAALIKTLARVRGGVDSTIAVDGPRGPLHVVKPGIILLAKLTGRPIVPLAACPKRFRRFKSWDRFRLPALFTKVTFGTLDPIHVPPDADQAMIEAKRAELEQKLRTLQQETDAYVQPKIKGFQGA